MAKKPDGRSSPPSRSRQSAAGRAAKADNATTKKSATSKQATRKPTTQKRADNGAPSKNAIPSKKAAAKKVVSKKVAAKNVPSKKASIKKDALKSGPAARAGSSRLKSRKAAEKLPVTSKGAQSATRSVETEAPKEDAIAGEKLQKVLARTGLGSRRELERWIAAGRISIDGRVAKLGDRVDERARLTLDGRAIKQAAPQETRCILYHKPPGEVCSRSDPEGRRTVFGRLPRLKSGRWISIGRLDFNTSGLLLFTTDGELANALMHPSSNIEREYMIRVMGDVREDMLQAMLDGVMLEDGVARFTDIQEASGDGVNRWFYVVLMEGRNREVRRLWESQGLTVSRLKRVRYGNVFIPSRVKQGQWVELEPGEVKSLYQIGDLPEKKVTRGNHKEKEAMERQFGKRHGRGVAKKTGRV